MPDYMVMASVRPLENSPHKGKFSIGYIGVFMRCEQESEVNAKFRDHLQEMGLEDVEILDAGYFRPEANGDPELKEAALAALDMGLVYSHMFHNPPGDADRFSLG